MSRFALVSRLSAFCLPVALIAFAALLLPASAPAQTISGLSQSLGASGTPITISGAGFGATQGSSVVVFGPVVGTPSSWSDTSIVVPVPSSLAAGDLTISVTVGGVSSNGVAFTVIPVIFGLSTYSGSPGTAVTISGGAFGATQGSSTITLNGLATTASSWSNSTIVTSVPAGASSGSLVVTVNGLSTNAVDFTVPTPASTISSLSPTAGPIGASVTITGTNFGDTQGSSRVLFAGHQGSPATSPTSWSATSITVPVPSGAITGGVAVAVNGQVSNFIQFTVSTLNVTALSPTSGPVGTSVTISGAGFGATQGSSTVTFNGTLATPSSWSDTQIVVPVPSGATTGNVVVTVAGIASNAVAFTVPPTLTSLAITPANTSVTSGATQQFTATGTFPDGSTSDVTSTVTWSSAASRVAGISSSGLVTAAAAGATTITARSGAVVASTKLTVTPWAPVITSASPNSGAAGTSVTISGSGFGNTQGSGSVQLGSNPALVTSWSDTQVVATVATGSVSGVAQIQQRGALSNSVSFSVTTPTISSISPTSGTAGTQVNISGSGFGSAQGNGQVWLGTALGQVSSWSDTLISATVDPSSTSGNAQVLQNGVWSNAVSFSISGNPHISSISPNTGNTGTVVTVRGTGFGSSQGSGSVLIGNVGASVNSWSDTQLSVTVGAGAVTGVAKVQQNGISSNAVSFAVPSSSSTTLVPAVLNMVVGDTRPIQALNPQSQPISGLAWTSSDTTIVTLSTDDPPLLTAVAPGNVTITAGGASADVTVFAGSTLPLGTVIWSNPGDGSGPVAALFPAVPSPTGVADVFAEQNDGSLQAVTSDGVVAWSFPTNDFSNAYLPDFQGGVVVLGKGNSPNPDTSIAKLDGLTGVPLPAYTTTTNEGRFAGLEFPAIHTDGTVFTVDYACNTDCEDTQSPPDTVDGAWVVGIDPTSGTAKFKVPLANSVQQSTVADSWCGGTPGTNTIFPHSWTNSSLMIAGDGFLYTTYSTNDITGTSQRSAAQRFPDSVYAAWDQLVQDTGAGNFNAALGDAGGLGGFVNTADILAALNRQDQVSAIIAEDSLAPFFVRLCDSSAAFTIKLHILRVGTDGSSSDMVVQQWSRTESTVYSGTPNGDGSNSIITTISQTAPRVVFDSVNSLTNADTGALFSWHAFQQGYCALSVDSSNPLQPNPQCQATVNTLIDNHLTTTAGTAIAADVIWQPPVATPFTAVSPALQLADGSFVGSAGFSPNMIAFDAAGNTRWVVPGYNPQMATADGSVIGQAGSTFDPGTGSIIPGPAATFDGNGSATGRLPALPTYTWKAAYQVGSTDSLIIPLPSLLASYAAIRNGNFTANATQVIQTSLGVIWCSNLISGSCQGQFIPPTLFGPAVQDLGFTYAPWIQMPTSNLSDFTTAHGEWVDLIISKAMAAVRNAYKNVPVMIQPVSFAGTPCHVSWNLTCAFFPKPPKPADYNHTVFITGNFCGQDVGVSIEGDTHSYVCYQDVMQNAQLALGSYDSNHIWQALSPTYSSALTRTDPAYGQFLSLMNAIGIGTGNVAVHETGHQFSLPQMDCDRPAGTNGSPAGPVCPGNGTHDLFYEFWSGNGLPPQVAPSGAGDSYLYPGPPMTWTNQDLTKLFQTFLKQN